VAPPLFQAYDPVTAQSGEVLPPLISELAGPVRNFHSGGAVIKLLQFAPTDLAHPQITVPDRTRISGPFMLNRNSTQLPSPSSLFAYEIQPVNAPERRLIFTSII
jgi:hypothetical protein